MGNTLGELMSTFAQASGNEDTQNEDLVHEQVLDGHNKTASDGGTKMAQESMGSLADLYLDMTEMDKTAAAAGGIPDGYEGGEPELVEEDLEKIAEAEAVEWQEHEEDESEKTASDDQDMMKVAAEYDAAGRIMARGFFDEYTKLAMEVSGSDNQGTDANSASSTPAFGKRELPNLATNYAGQAEAGTKSKQQAINTSGGKEANKNILKPSGSKAPGSIVGENIDAHAGGGFANVRDMMGSNR